MLLFLAVHESRQANPFSHSRLFDLYIRLTLYCSPGQVDLLSENSQMDSTSIGPALMAKSSQPVDSVQRSFTLRACSSSVCAHFLNKRCNLLH